MSKQSAAHYFLEGLADLGIDHIFGNLGTDHVSIIEELARWEKEGRPHPRVILVPARDGCRAYGGRLRARDRAWTGRARACRCGHGKLLHGAGEPLSLPPSGDAAGRPRSLYDARRASGITRCLCALRAGPFRHGEHRAPLREVGIFAPLRRGRQGGAAARSFLHAERSARPGLHDASARDLGGDARRSSCEHLFRGEIRAGASRRRRARARRGARRSADGR